MRRHASFIHRSSFFVDACILALAASGVATGDVVELGVAGGVTAGANTHCCTDPFIRCEDSDSLPFSGMSSAGGSANAQCTTTAPDGGGSASAAGSADASGSATGSQTQLTISCSGSSNAQSNTNLSSASCEGIGLFSSSSGSGTLRVSFRLFTPATYTFQAQGTAVQSGFLSNARVTIGFGRPGLSIFFQTAEPGSIDVSTEGFLAPGDYTLSFQCTVATTSQCVLPGGESGSANSNASINLTINTCPGTSGGCGSNGVCCYPDGSCLEVTNPPTCPTNGGLTGVWMGFDSTCDECPQPGVCCYPDGSCQPVNPDGTCPGQCGTFLGPNSICSDCPILSAEEIDDDEQCGCADCTVEMLLRDECGDGTDSDMDGIPDDWETCGIPYLSVAGSPARKKLDFDGDGQSDAKVGRKDIFVEIDAMTGFAPPDLEPVRVAFANAPIVNPDGSPGIKLHILRSDVDLQVIPNLTWRHFDSIKRTRFGTPDDRMEPNFIAERLKIVHYFVYCDVNFERSLAVTRARRGNTMVSKGAFTNGPDHPGEHCKLCPLCTDEDLILWMQSNFMHELGHQLGLDHNGITPPPGDPIKTYNPIYISVMNYTYQFPYKLNRRKWELDFSNGSMNRVKEENINERVGFTDRLGNNNGRSTYYSQVSCHAPPNQCSPVRAPLSLKEYRVGWGAHDFDGDGNPNETSVCMDLNYFPDVPGHCGAIAIGSAFQPSPCDEHVDHDDWQGLKYDLIREGSRGDFNESFNEPTAAEVRALLDAMPEDCRADTYPEFGDGKVDVLDLFTLLSEWGACAESCVSDIESQHGDGVVDTLDLFYLLDKWGDC